jgi:hypothetical protein
LFTLRRFVKGGLAAGIAGAVLGGVVSFLQMSTHLAVDKFDQSAGVAFQNFAIYLGAGAGIAFGLAGVALFLILVPRFQYPASTRLGAYLGAAIGVLLCLATSLTLNAFARLFDYLPSATSVLLVNSLITMAVGGVVGVSAGYLMAEIGARNLR